MARINGRGIEPRRLLDVLAGVGHACPFSASDQALTLEHAAIPLQTHSLPRALPSPRAAGTSAGLPLGQFVFSPRENARPDAFRRGAPPKDPPRSGGLARPAPSCNQVSAPCTAIQVHRAAAGSRVKPKKTRHEGGV